MKKKIFVFGFCKGGYGVYYALSEDGYNLGSHLCSHEGFAKDDLGCDGSRPDRHKNYKEIYPDGYEMVFVPDSEVSTNEAVQRAIRLNKEEALLPEHEHLKQK